MKTVQKGAEILRVTDSEASSLVKSGWSYVTKSIWKEKVRAPKAIETAKEVAALEAQRLADKASRISQTKEHKANKKN